MLCHIRWFGPPPLFAFCLQLTTNCFAFVYRREIGKRIDIDKSVFSLYLDELEEGKGAWDFDHRWGCVGTKTNLVALNIQTKRGRSAADHSQLEK